MINFLQKGNSGGFFKVTALFILVGSLLLSPLTFRFFGDKFTFAFNGTTNSYYPKSPQKPTNLYQIDPAQMSTVESTMVATLQGVVAKNRPQIYIGTSTDNWLLDLKANYGVTVTPVTSAWTLIDTFKATVSNHYILYQTSDSSLNVATSLAGIDNAVAIDATIEATAKSHGLTLLIDVRGKDDNWLKTNYWSQFRHDMAFEQAESQPYALRDYGPMTNSLTFYNSDDTFRTSLLAGLDPDSPILGWGGGLRSENVFVGQSSTAGNLTVAADFATNLSTLSAIQQSSFSQHTHLPTPVAKSGTHYVSFLMSDGDNVQWMLRDFRTASLWWGNPQRGTFNMGWGISPALADLAPSAMNWYYNNASNGTFKDSFTVAPSGTGYFYPSMYPADKLNTQLTRLNSYMGETDLSVAQVIDLNAINDVALWNKYTAQPNIQGMIYMDYTDYALGKGGVNWSNGKPVVSPRYYLWAAGPGSNETQIINGINALPGNPQSTDGYSLVVVNAWTKSLDNVRTIINGLNPNVEVVTPETLFKLMSANVPHAATTYEAESLPATTSGPANTLSSDANCNGGACMVFQSQAVADTITYTVQITQPGTYDIRVGAKKLNNKGIFQFASNGVNHGTPQDLYSATVAYTELDIGNVNFVTTGSKSFTFSVTGKNASATGYTLGLDYIKLMPQFTPTNNPTPTPTNTPKPVATNTPTPTSTPVTGTTLKYEMESLTSTTNGPANTISNDAGCSGGVCMIFQSVAAGNVVTYTVQIPTAATYDLRVGVKKYSNKGIFQFASNGVNHGTPQDLYSATATFPLLDLGNVTFTTSGTKSFTFTLTGKNAASSGYTLGLDYMQLIPQ